MQTAIQQSCKAPVFCIDANWLPMTGLESDTAFVKELCRWARAAPSKVATESGLTPTTLLRPYNGAATTRISQPTFDKLRARFPEFPGWRRELPDQMGMHGDRPDPSIQPSELVYIREVDISYAMGDGLVVEDYPSVGLVPFNLDFVRKLSPSDTDHLFIATGQGESMEPTLLRSDMLMIDTTKRQIGMSEGIWALTYAGGGMVKRVRRVREAGRDMFLLLSDNPVVPPQSAEIEDVNIVGKVVWVGRRMAF